MKYMNHILIAFIAAGIFSGCSSSWNQDPLADKNKVLHDGLDGPTRDEKPAGVESDYVRLPGVDKIFAAIEGQTTEIELKGSILLPDYTSTLIFENIDEFSGAQYDASSGKFKWTPPLGTVSPDLQTPSVTKLLKVRVVCHKPGDEVYQRSFVVVFDVKKVLNAPQILNISNTNFVLREGSEATLTFTIHDNDAGTAENTWPRIQLSPLLAYMDLSQFVRPTSFMKAGNGVYTVRLNVDLRGAELTKSKGAYGFTIQAFSQFGAASAKQEVKVQVLTSFSDLQSTWFDTWDVYLGVKDELQFVIYDPKDELTVEVPTFSGLPAGASVDCKSLGVVTRQLCKVTWSPDMTSVAGDFTIRANVSTRNQDSSDTQIKSQAFNLQMRVNSAAPTGSISQAGGN